MHSLKNNIFLVSQFFWWFSCPHFHILVQYFIGRRQEAGRQYEL